MLIDKLLCLFRKEPQKFIKFNDPLNNFELFYPKGFRYDQDVAVYNWSYTISFESKHERLIVSVDSKKAVDFDKYVEQEFNSPKSGIISNLRKSVFRGFPSYDRDFQYTDSGRDYIGKGIVFYTGSIIYSLTWMSPNRDLGTFDHIVKSFTFRT